MIHLYGRVTKFFYCDWLSIFFRRMQTGCQPALRPINMLMDACSPQQWCYEQRWLKLSPHFKMYADRIFVQANFFERSSFRASRQESTRRLHIEASIKCWLMAIIIQGLYFNGFLKHTSIGNYHFTNCWNKKCARSVSERRASGDLAGRGAGGPEDGGGDGRGRMEEAGGWDKDKPERRKAPILTYKYGMDRAF